MLTEKCCYSRINRIRLEFKEINHHLSLVAQIRINRIRLEFKERYGTINDRWSGVLIESDWNLKIIDWKDRDIKGFSINRIRLEFKG